MRRRNGLLMVLAGLAAALIAGRAALPFFVKDYVNDRLQALEAYDGSVEDVDIGLWRGAYRMDGIEIVKTGAQQPTPFFTSDRVDFSVEWHSLLRGSPVSEAVFIGSKLNLVQARSEEESQLGEEKNWASRLEEHSRGARWHRHVSRARHPDRGRKEGHAAFAEALMLHAGSEEELLYPTTLLIGEYLELRQRADE